VPPGGDTHPERPAARLDLDLRQAPTMGA
jgi:hypothetical protein